MPDRILVTGGAGFIGSSIAIALAERHPNHEILACDNLYRRGSELNLPRLRAAGVGFHHADVRQPGELAAIGPVGAIIECSAEPSVHGSSDVIVPVNLLGAYNCFEHASRHGAQVVFLSTSRVYPVAPQEQLSFTETDTRFELAAEQPFQGAGPDGISELFGLTGARTMYGASKLAAELLLGEYELPWVINRCGVIAGPWQMGRVDQGVFTHWVLSAIGGRPLRYFGYGGSGKQVRDLLHVDDLVDLVDLQIRAPKHWAGQTFNVGGGREISLSLLETTELCRELTGAELDVAAAGADRRGDVRIYLSDCRALYAHTDWRPRRSARDVLTDIHRWASEHAGLLAAALE